MPTARERFVQSEQARAIAIPTLVTAGRMIRGVAHALRGGSPSAALANARLSEFVATRARLLHPIPILVVERGRRLDRPLLHPSSMEARVSDIMNPKLLYVREGDRLAMVRSKILAFGVTAIPVLDDDHRPVGVVSLRDFEGDEPVKASSPARVLRSDMSVAEGARQLADSDLHHLVVVDDHGVAVGMVSAIDFVRALVGLPSKHPQAFAVL